MNRPCQRAVRTLASQYSRTTRHTQPTTSILQPFHHDRQAYSTTLPNSFLPVPFVTEQLAGASHSTDLFSRLLKERIVAVYGPVEDRMAATVTASLLFLESDSDAPISMYINSPGGSVSAGLSIYDTMQYISSPVHTIVLGQAASMGSLLATAGAPGKRFALPHATVMMHQPSGGYSGTSADIQIHAKEIMRIRDLLNGVYRKHLTPKGDKDEEGKMKIGDIERLMDRDYFMSAEEAVRMGVVDEVLESRKKIDDTKKD
ncbi:hypothetical protein BT93_L4223 [Corymbia citriodora subsp. variegata]|uniref:ATP-dependent Clp protease proteolytic subunit n=1 Tax=Corymbia citriodora subsp. variegata TaxID=360336 RepID=A0A8T0CG81_CORYI|nr:hypothetical protein BT93_L4223 [Corymbia citriodora subsp. variegata]